MTYGTTRIKNLSIALKAISQVNGCRSEYDRIRDLLSEALNQERKEFEESTQAATPTLAQP